jgi:hypothetical protein
LDYFLDRPIALTILAVSLLVAIMPAFGFVRNALGKARAVNEL